MDFMNRCFFFVAYLREMISKLLSGLLLFIYIYLFSSYKCVMLMLEAIAQMEWLFLFLSSVIRYPLRSPVRCTPQVLNQYTHHNTVRWPYTRHSVRMYRFPSYSSVRGKSVKIHFFTSVLTMQRILIFSCQNHRP